MKAHIRTIPEQSGNTPITPIDFQSYNSVLSGYKTRIEQNENFVLPPKDVRYLDGLLNEIAAKYQPGEMVEQLRRTIGYLMAANDIHRRNRYEARLENRVKSIYAGLDNQMSEGTLTREDKKRLYRRIGYAYRRLEPEHHGRAYG